MKQRAALMWTFLSRKGIVALDEPFGALDAHTRLKMQRWLAGVGAELGATVILVTHDVEEALILSDRVIVLSARPATVVEEIPVPLERPRDLLDPTFVLLKGELLARLDGAGASEKAVVEHVGFDDTGEPDAALILAGGDLDPDGGQADLLRGPWQHVICADGGARHARALGLEPTLLVGDMDSIDETSRKMYVDVPSLTFPVAKDKTDSQARDRVGDGAGRPAHRPGRGSGKPVRSFLGQCSVALFFGRGRRAASSPMAGRPCTPSKGVCSCGRPRVTCFGDRHGGVRAEPQGASVGARRF